MNDAKPRGRELPEGEEQESTYSDYEKYRTDGRIVGFGGSGVRRLENYCPSAPLSSIRSASSSDSIGFMARC